MTRRGGFTRSGDETVADADESVWVDRWVDGWMDGYSDGWVDREMDGWMNEEVNVSVDGCNHE